jgi:hypothetical protein
MKKSYVFFSIIFIAFLSSCVSQNYNSVPQNNNDNRNTNKNITIYTLEKGEKLKTFIETQNKMNQLSRFENFPTNEIYKELIIKYEEFAEETFKEYSGKNNSDFQDEYKNMDLDEIINAFKNIAFIYHIKYDNKLRVWYLELIGRSTTLSLEFTSNIEYARGKGFQYSGVIPYVNDWMDLNNIPSVDNILRVYAEIDRDVFRMEFFGEHLE